MASQSNDAAPTGWPAVGERFWYVPVFLLYVFVVFWTIAHHEPWSDEAQAWLIARDTPIWPMLADVLRYEGTPPLWHLICAFLARIGLPYAWLPYVGGAIASCGVLFFLRVSPFPRWLTAVVPFSYYLCYQYAVVARSYVLAPLAVFALAWIWDKRHVRPFAFCLLLILLANLSAFGFLIAGSLMLLHLVSLRTIRGRYTPRLWRWLAAGFALYCIVCLAIVAQVFPPSDGSFLAWVEERQLEEPSLIDALFGMPLHAISGSQLASAVVLIASIVLFVRERTLHLYLLPTAACGAFSSVIHSGPHHTGLFQLVWLFAIWITYRRLKYARGVAKIDQWLFFNATCVFLISSCFATVISVSSDLRDPYCGAGKAAQYIQSRRDEIGAIIGFGFGTAGISAYFDEPVFENIDNCHGSSFWFWSTRQNVAVRPDRRIDMAIFPTLAEPAAILPWTDPAFRFYFDPCFSYRVFDGHCFFHGDVMDRLAVIIFERRTNQDAPEPPVAEIVAGYAPLFERYVVAGKYKKAGLTLRNVLAGTHVRFARGLERLMPETADLHYRIALELEPEDTELRAEYAGFLASMESSGEESNQ